MQRRPGDPGAELAGSFEQMRLLAAALGLVGVVLGTQLATAGPLPRVPRSGVLERSFRFSTSATNPWEQVRLTVNLTAPNGRHVSIGGFFAGGDTWKFRYAPAELGRWSWTARIADAAHAVTRRGAFVAVPSGSPGFVERSPYN